MIPIVVWNYKFKVYHDGSYMITHLRGYKTIGCQCFSDCTCSQDNRQGAIQKFRVSGRTRRIHIPKPFDFDTMEDAKKRINELKQN